MLGQCLFGRLITQKANSHNLFYIVPAFNEADVIVQTIADLKDNAPPGKIVVIDDGSTDGTGRVAVSAGVMVLRHIMNRGQGAALQTGLAYARQNDADLAVTFDADGQHNAKDISSLIEPITNGDYDVVLASRFLPGASAVHMPMGRKTVLKAGVFFTRITSRVHITDVHNGLRAFSRRAIQEIRMQLDDMAHASEVYDQIYHNRLSYTEVPCQIRYTDYSKKRGQRSRAAVRIGLRFFLSKLRP